MHSIKITRAVTVRKYQKSGCHYFCTLLRLRMLLQLKSTKKVAATLAATNYASQNPLKKVFLFNE